MKKFTFRKLTKKQILKTIFYSGSVGIMMFMLTTFLIGCEIVNAHPEDYPFLMEEVTFYGVTMTRAYFFTMISTCFACFLIFTSYSLLLYFLINKLFSEK